MSEPNAIPTIAPIERLLLLCGVELSSEAEGKADGSAALVVMLEAGPTSVPEEIVEIFEKELDTEILVELLMVVVVEASIEEREEEFIPQRSRVEETTIVGQIVYWGQHIGVPWKESH